MNSFHGIVINPCLTCTKYIYILFSVLFRLLYFSFGSDFFSYDVSHFNYSSGSLSDDNQQMSISSASMSESMVPSVFYSIPYIFDLTLIGEAALTHYKPYGISILIKDETGFAELLAFCGTLNSEYRERMAPTIAGSFKKICTVKNNQTVIQWKYSSKNLTMTKNDVLKFWVIAYSCNKQYSSFIYEYENRRGVRRTGIIPHLPDVLRQTSNWDSRSGRVSYDNR